MDRFTSQMGSDFQTVRFISGHLATLCDIYHHHANIELTNLKGKSVELE